MVVPVTAVLVGAAVAVSFWCAGVGMLGMLGILGGFCSGGSSGGSGGSGEFGRGTHFWKTMHA